MADLFVAVGSDGRGAISTCEAASSHAVGSARMVAVGRLSAWTLSWAMLTGQVLPVRFSLEHGAYEVPTGTAISNGLRREVSRW
jgi:hypothetical protein